MAAILLLILLALLLGGVGLLVEGLYWLLVISLGLFLASALWGAVGRGRY